MSLGFAKEKEQNRNELTEHLKAKKKEIVIFSVIIVIVNQ